MEFNKPMDVASFDWDDTELIKAYDLGHKNRKSLKSKGSKNNKEKGKDEKSARIWQPGNYCRAIYQEDGLLYEATVIDIQGNSCTVEFLGYGDYQEVPLDTLEESLGKKARQKQRKSVKKAEVSVYTVTSDTDYTHCTSTPVPQIPHAPALSAPYSTHAPAVSAPYSTHAPAVSTPFFTHAPASLPMPSTHAPAVSAVQRMGGAAHCLPPPPPPPMPPCSAASNDPSLSAMLVSWYMAGYYTGLHQSQKSSHCLSAPKPHCCEHHVPNHCGHCF